MTSILKVDSIQNAAGTAAVTIDSAGRVNMANTTQIDMWRLDSSFSTNGAYVTGWSRCNHATHANAGLGMTESSGVFTFPNTGLWKVHAVLWFSATSSDTSYGCVLQVSSDGGSVFTAVADSYEAENSQGNASLLDLVNVTNASNFQIRLKTAGFDSGTQLSGSSDKIRTGILFERITDAQ